MPKILIPQTVNPAREVEIQDVSIVSGVVHAAMTDGSTFNVEIPEALETFKEAIYTAVHADLVRRGIAAERLEDVAEEEEAMPS